MRGRLGAVAAALLCLCASDCAPQLLEVQQVSSFEKVDDRELVPVGGYQMLGGEWQCERSDELLGKGQALPLLVSVEKNVLSATAPEHGMQLRCEAHNRTCLGTWSDNAGHGRVALTFSADFQQFSGTYDGTRRGQDVGRSSFTGRRR